VQKVAATKASAKKESSSDDDVRVWFKG